MLALLTLIPSGVRLGLVLAAILAVLAAGGTVVHQLRSSGYDSRVAEEAAEASRRTTNANRADDAARRCAADSDCRLRDDGFRRD